MFHVLSHNLMLTLHLLICVFIFAYPRETSSSLTVHFQFPSQHANTNRLEYSNLNQVSIKTLPKPLQNQGSLEKRGQKERRPSEGTDACTKTPFQRHVKDCFACILIKAETACLRPAQNQAFQNPRMEGGRSHEVAPLLRS